MMTRSGGAMKKALVSFAFALVMSLCAVSVRGESGFFGKSAVIEATSANYNNLLYEKQNTVVVKYYSPGCGHCIRFAPEFKKAARQLKHAVTFVGVNCMTHGHLCTMAQVDGVPKVMIHHMDHTGKKRVMTEFRGEREASALIGQLKYNTPRVIKQAGVTQSKLEKLLSKDNSTHAKVLYVSPKKYSDDLKLNAVALKHFNYAHLIHFTDSSLSAPELHVIVPDDAGSQDKEAENSGAEAKDNVIREIPILRGKKGEDEAFNFKKVHEFVDKHLQKHKKKYNAEIEQQKKKAAAKKKKNKNKDKKKVKDEL